MLLATLWREWHHTAIIEVTQHIGDQPILGHAECLFSLLGYSVIPYGPGLAISDFNLGILWTVGGVWLMVRLEISKIREAHWLLRMLWGLSAGIWMLTIGQRELA